MCAGTPATSSADSPMAEATASGERAWPSDGRPPVRVAPSSSTTQVEDADAALLAEGAGRQAAGAHEGVGRADARVAGERQLGERREDAHPVVGAGLGGRAEERRLRQVELDRERLALLGAQRVGVEHHGQRIARVGPRREHVDDLVLQEFRARHGPDGSLPIRDHGDQGIRLPARRADRLRPQRRPGRQGPRRRRRAARRHRRAAGAGPGRRGGRAAPDLRADGPGHRDRVGCGAARLGHPEPQALRAAGRRDPRARRAAGPHRADQGVRPARARRRRRHGADPHRRLGAVEARRPGAGPARPPRAAAPARLGRGRRAWRCRSRGRAPRRCSPPTGS